MTINGHGNGHDDGVDKNKVEMEGDDDMEEEGLSVDLSAAGVVCPQKYDETDSCGSAAHFLSDMTINGACTV